MILALFGLPIGRALVAYGLGAPAPVVEAFSPGGAGFFASQPKQLPQWVADDQGLAFEQSFGWTKDYALDLYKQATKARYPDPRRPDALPYQGHDRLILRAPPETNGEYAARLLQAPDLWVWGGTPTAIVNIFEPYGYDATDLIVVPNWYGILDGNTSCFSRFIILADGLAWESDGLWSSPGNYDDGGVWDSTATVADLDYIRGSVRIWKSPWSYPCLMGVKLPDVAGDAFWDFPPDVYDEPNTFWDDNGGADVTYWLIGEFWGLEVFFGGHPVWDEPGDVWGDFVEPSTGWGFALS